jgi:hypothetical protein
MDFRALQRYDEACAQLPPECAVLRTLWTHSWRAQCGVRLHPTELPPGALAGWLRAVAAAWPGEARILYVGRHAAALATAAGAVPHQPHLWLWPSSGSRLEVFATPEAVGELTSVAAVGKAVLLLDQTQFMEPPRALQTLLASARALRVPHVQHNTLYEACDGDTRVWYRRDDEDGEVHLVFAVADVRFILFYKPWHARWASYDEEHAMQAVQKQARGPEVRAALTLLLAQLLADAGVELPDTRGLWTELQRRVPAINLL